MKKILVLIVTFLSLICFGCGKDKTPSEQRVFEFDTSPTSTPNATPTSTISGPCEIIGNIRSFEIVCTKPIESFTFHANRVELTYSETLIIMTRLNGVRYNTHIKNLGTSVVGSEGIVESLDLTINFTDSTSTPVALSL